MKLVIASDHGGFDLKKDIVRFLAKRGLEVVDLGTHDTESVDYPDYAEKVGTLVSGGQADAGILICGTGIGMSIMANKFKGVRAAVVHDLHTAKMAKEHNNANVLCLGGRLSKSEEAREMVRLWLDTTFEGGRHTKRLEKIERIEKKNCP